MAKKPYDFRKMSEVRCGNPDCRKPLKKNVVERKPEGALIFCWACWVKKTRDMSLSTYKKYRAVRVKIRNEGGDPRAAMRVGV